MMKRISLVLVLMLVLSGINYSQERAGAQRPSTGTTERGAGQRPTTGTTERGAGQRPSGSAAPRGAGQRPSSAGEAGRPGNMGNMGNRQNMTPEERLKRQTQTLVEQYKLSKDQEKKVTEINKKYSEKQTMDFSKMMDATDEERTKMGEEMRKIQADKDKEIKAILTPAQAKLFDENQKKRAEMMRNNPGGRFGGGAGPR